MRTRYKIFDSNAPYFVTFTTVEWIPIFTSEKYCDIIIDSFSFCREHKSTKVHAFVIMDNHLHVILSCSNLPGVVRDIKSFTARELIASIKSDNKTWLLNQLEFYKGKSKTESKYQLWQEGYHPEEIFSEKIFVQKAEYIHNNPVKRGLVRVPEHWKYSSACNYIGATGVIDIDRLT